MKGRLSFLEDQALVARTLSGDELAFEALVRRYTPMVMGYLFRKTNGQADSEDLAQEIFLTSYRYLHNLRSTEQFGNWLMRIVKTKLIDYYRHNSRRPQIVLNEGDLTPEDYNPLDHEQDKSESPREATEHVELQDIILGELSHMKEKYRQILMLKLVGEKTTAEIASQLGLKESAVRMRVFRGMKLLRAALKRAGVKPQ